MNYYQKSYKIWNAETIAFREGGAASESWLEKMLGNLGNDFRKFRVLPRPGNVEWMMGKFGQILGKNCNNGLKNLG